MQITAEVDFSQHITHAQLEELTHYNPSSGQFLWNRRARNWFSTDHQCNAWNGRFCGKPAGQLSASSGYIQIRVLRRLYQAHRLAWLYTYGNWPEAEIDHINHDKADNRIANLRSVAHFENCCNREANANNKSGVCGVFFLASVGKWCAQISDNGRQIGLGRFKSKSDAVAARRLGEIRFNYHQNHGKVINAAK